MNFLGKPLDEATKEFVWLMSKNKEKIFLFTLRLMKVLNNVVVTNEPCYSDFQSDDQSY